MEFRRALITGTSSGLGRALLDAFINAGWAGQGTTHLSGETVPDIDRGKYWPLDATTGASLFMGARMLAESVDPLDCLINNAGTNAIRPFEELDSDFVEKIMRVNFLLPVMLTQNLLRAGKLKKGAVVVNIISDAAWRPMRHSLAYNCSKAALDMATKQMARELTKPYGISVIGIRPGKMSGTEMSKYIDASVCALRGWTPQEAHDYFVANTVTGKEIDPEHVANLICHLVTGGLAPAMSGACVDLVG